MDRRRHAASLALTLLVALAFASLVADDPPWGRDWRDGHYQLGLLLGFGTTAWTAAVLAGPRLHRAVFLWLAALAVGGLILGFSCWALLGVSAAT